MEMSSDLIKSMHIASSGMNAQAERMKIISQNLANKNSTGASLEELPYMRKTISFREEFDRGIDANKVSVSSINRDKSAPIIRFEPNHTAANEAGYVMYPNIRPEIEIADAKEAQLSYQANLKSLEIAKSMALRTLEVIK